MAKRGRKVVPLAEESPAAPVVLPPLERSFKLAIAALLAVFTIFSILNRHQGLALFDASEYSTHIEGAGIAHAPGYPLYTLLGKFFGLFGADPFTAQFLISLASTFGTVIALIATFRMSRFWSPWAAILTVTLFLSSYYVKLYVLMPEVFLLNMALFAGLFWASANWFRDPSNSWKFGLAFVFYGMGFAHHHTLALTLPASLILIGLRFREIKWKTAIPAAFIGSFLGALPIFYLFVASSPEPNYSYYEVKSFEDLLFVILRKGYGTFALTVFPTSAPKSEIFKLVLGAYFRTFNYVGFATLLPFLWRPNRVAVRRAAREEPALILALVTLLVYFTIFVPQFNIPLTFAKYRHIVLRFVTVPGFLSIYPAYYGLRRLLELRPGRVTAGLALLVLLASNVVGWRDLRFSGYDLLHRHIEGGFRTILSRIDPTPVSEISSQHLRCAILVRPDALVFGVRYWNEFKTDRKCFFFTLSSFSGQFRAKQEEILQRSVLREDYGELLVRHQNEPQATMAILLERLKRLNFRVFLFYPTDAVVLQQMNPRYRYRPVGNIQEVVFENETIPAKQLVDEQVQYLSEMDAYLDSLAKRSLTHVLFDESVTTGIFQNVMEYRRLTAPLYGPNPALRDLDAKVQAKLDAFLATP